MIKNTKLVYMKAAQLLFKNNNVDPQNRTIGDNWEFLGPDAPPVTHPTRVQIPGYIPKQLLFFWVNPSKNRQNTNLKYK